MWSTCSNPWSALAGTHRRPPVDRRHTETAGGVHADSVLGCREDAQVLDASRPCAVIIDFESEQRVRVNRLGNGVFYDAMVSEKNNDGTYNLLFDDGLAEANVTLDRIEPARWGWDSIRSKVEFMSLLRKPEDDDSSETAFAKMLPDTKSQLLVWLEKRQESVESVLESAFARTLTEHSVSSTESDAENTDLSPKQPVTNEGLAAFMRAHEKMTEWMDMVKKTSLESVPHCAAIPPSTTPGVVTWDVSDPLVSAKLEQAEGYSTVRVYSQPVSNSARVGEIPSGEQVLGKRPCKGAAFMWVSWQGMQGYVGWKNVVGDSLVSLDLDSSTIALEGISKRHILKLGVARAQCLERMLRELFNLHDLNGDGVLEEAELVQLNAKIAMLNLGASTDTTPVKERYRTVFREELNSGGEPVAYPIFRKYMLQVLDSTDPDPASQELILEHQVEVAKSARGAFRIASFESVSDAAFMPFLREAHPVFSRDGSHHIGGAMRCNSLSLVEEALLDDTDDEQARHIDQGVASVRPHAVAASEDLDKEMAGLWSECSKDGAYL